MRNRRITNIPNFKSTMFGVEKFQVRQPSLIDTFHYEYGICDDTGEDTCTYHNPLYMLFNQERLDRLGDGAIQMWLKQLDSANNSAYNDLKSKISDSDLLKLVKSRHIQHPSELESWMNYLSERADICNAEIEKIINEEKEKSGNLPPTDDELNNRESK